VWNPALCESRPYVRVATITQDNLLNIRWNPALCESRPYVRVAAITQDNLLNIRYCHFLTACNCRAGPDLCFRLVVADSASLHVINSEFMKHRRQQNASLSYLQLVAAQTLHWPNINGDIGLLTCPSPNNCFC
jgi:hypothetical protein